MTMVHDLSPQCLCERLCPQLVKCHVNESEAFPSWRLSGELTTVFVWRTSTPKPWQQMWIVRVGVTLTFHLANPHQLLSLAVFTCTPYSD